MAGCGNELAPRGWRGRGGPQRGGKPVKVAPADPAGGYFVSVEAKGSGCPEGSWETSVSEDGQVFTTTFSAYEVMLEPDVQRDAKDCRLKIKLHSPQGLSFSVTSVAYSGYASLEESQRVSFTTRYGFRGEAGSTRRDEVGPYDSSFVFEDRVTQARQVWSPCGSDHDLAADTQLSLHNGEPAGAAYANIAAVDGSTQLTFGLSWRSCRTGRAH